MDEPFLLMIAGPNGSGKTTLTRWLRDRGIDFGEYINPDDIAQSLKGSLAQRSADAQAIAGERRQSCIAARRSFSFETVMSHESKIEVLLQAKEAGYSVYLYFVGTDDPRTNVERVALRVAQGGHSVPEDKIVSRWSRTMGLLSQAVRAADRAYIFDNSSAIGLGATPRLVLHRSVAEPSTTLNVQIFGTVPAWVRRYVIEPLNQAAAARPPRVRI